MDAKSRLSLDALPPALPDELWKMLQAELLSERQLSEAWHRIDGAENPWGYTRQQIETAVDFVLSRSKAVGTRKMRGGGGAHGRGASRSPRYWRPTLEWLETRDLMTVLFGDAPCIGGESAPACAAARGAVHLERVGSGCAALPRHARFSRSAWGDKARGDGQRFVPHRLLDGSVVDWLFQQRRFADDCASSAGLCGWITDN